MDRPAGRAGFGTLLKRWRGHRGLSQLALSLDAGVSARHLSWLESGKASPSRAMVLRLAERLDLPLRERNALLLAAGYAPLYGERPLSDPTLASVRVALQSLLDAHEPAPALAVDRHWNLVAHNRLVPLLLAQVAHLAPALRAEPVNVLRLSLHPEGLAPMIENLGAWRQHVLARLQRQWQATQDEALAGLLAELRALPAPAGSPPEDHNSVVVPLVLNTPHGRLSFLTAVTVFGAPHDVTLAEIAIETLLPADAATAAALHGLVHGRV
jgi:transcriptional regulator with XRE-family HTH domain